MFICNGKPDYGWLKKIKALEPHVFQQWLNRAPSLKAEIQKKRGIDSKEHEPLTQANFPDLYINDGLLMDEEEVSAWNEVGVEIAVTRVKGIASNARELQQIIFKVCIAGIGPLQIQCVDYIAAEPINSDRDVGYGIEEVNRWLAKGWRILSVTPPADNSFPVFIMGHIDKEPHR